MIDLQNRDDMTALLLVVSLVTLAYMFVKTRGPRHRLPPGPPGLPIIGNLHQMGQLPHQDLHRLAGQYGPLMRLYLGSAFCVVASSPEVVRELLKDNESAFLNQARVSVMDRLFYPASDFMFAEAGPYWKFMKKICVSRLLGGRALEGLAGVRRDERARLLRSALRRARAGEEFDVEAGVAGMVSDTIARMVIGQRCSDGEFGAVVKEASELLVAFNLSDFLWPLRNIDAQGLWRKTDVVHQRLDRMVEQILSERREARERGEEAGDVLDVLLDLFEDDNGSSEVKLTRENVKSFTLEMFLSATDTTAKAIEWAMSELINSQDAMTKAREEIDSVVGKTRLVEESDIENLPYIQAVVKETLRLHPTVPYLLRQSTKKVSVGGYDLPEKTRLFVNLWGMGRDPKYWDDPLRFRPERFLGEQGGGRARLVDLTRGQNWKLLPFGAGKRLCPGAAFGLQVVPATVAAMIQCFEWKVDELSMEEGRGISVPRAQPLVCAPVPRLLNLDQLVDNNVV